MNDLQDSLWQLLTALPNLEKRSWMQVSILAILIGSNHDFSFFRQ